MNDIAASLYTSFAFLVLPKAITAEGSNLVFTAVEEILTYFA